MNRNVRLIELERAKVRHAVSALIVVLCAAVGLLAAYADEHTENLKLRDMCELRSK